MTAVKTTIAHRRDGRKTATIKLVGWTQQQIEDLIFELGGPSGWAIGATLRRQLEDRPKNATTRELTAR